MLKIQGVNKNSGGKSAGGKTFINVNFTAFYAFKLVNYSRHSEILNSRKNSKSTSFSFKNSDFTVFKNFSKTHCDSTNGRKRCKKKYKDVSYQCL